MKKQKNKIKGLSATFGEISKIKDALISVVYFVV